MDQIAKIKETTEDRHPPHWFCPLLLIIIIGVLTSCKANKNTSPTLLPTDVIFTSPITSVPMVHVSPVMPVSGYNECLPEGAHQVSAQYMGDFDSDGQQELVTSYRNSNGQGGGIIVADILETGCNLVWQTQLPPGLTSKDFRMQDLNSNESPELLLFAENDTGVKLPLFIYTWEGATYTLLKPQAGPLDGQDFFLSLYWAPILDDIDSNGTTEIIVFIENKTNPETLSAVVYEWNGREFHYTDLYIIPPRFKPATTTE